MKVHELQARLSQMNPNFEVALLVLTDTHSHGIKNFHVLEWKDVHAVVLSGNVQEKGS